jgi:DNA polymerase kappa
MHITSNCHFQGRTVTIKLKTVIFEVKTRAQSLMEHTSDPGIIFSTAKELLRLEIQACQPSPLRLRLLGKATPEK